MKRHRMHLLLLAAGLLALVCGAQEPAETASGMAGIARDGERTLGVAPGYRAEFRPGAVVFTPALGETAPRKLPLTLTLESIARGDGTVVHRAEPRALPLPRVDERRREVVYPRGPLALERYEVRGDGLAQSFSFPAPLPGSGDLVVRFRVATELTAEDGETTAVTFDSPAGGVHLGTITGIDALDRRSAGSFRVAPETLELRLPAAFVDRAAYPLVLDPLIGSRVTVSGSQDAIHSEGAYDETSGVYLVAYHVRFSALDADVFAARLDAGGNALGTVALAATSQLEVRPAVAAIHPSGRFLVAWQQAPTPFGIWDVHGRAIDAATGSQSATVALAATSAQQTAPDLAGEASAGDDAVLVWREDGVGIAAVAVDVPATGDPTAATPAVITTDPTAGAPRVCKSGGAPGRSVVAWLQEPAAGTGQIASRAVDRSGAPVGPVLLVGAAEAHRNGTAFDVDGDGTDFLLVYDRSTDPAGGLRDVFVQKLRWNGAALNEVGTPVAVADDPNEGDSSPRIALLATKYLVVFLHDILPFPSSVRLVHAVVSPDCRVCGTSGDVGNGGVSSRDTGPAIASQWSGGMVGDEALILYTNHSVLVPFAGQVLAQRFDAMVGQPLTTVFPGCGNGGTAGTNGPFALGNSDFRFTLSGADPAATFAGMSLAIAAPPLTCGSCHLLTPAALFFTVPSAGAASVPFPVPCDAIFLGLPIEFQWLVFGAAGNPCPLAGMLATSEWQRVVNSR